MSDISELSQSLNKSESEVEKTIKDLMDSFGYSRADTISMIKYIVRI